MKHAHFMVSSLLAIAFAFASDAQAQESGSLSDGSSSTSQDLKKIIGDQGINYVEVAQQGVTLSGYVDASYTEAYTGGLTVNSGTVSLSSYVNDGDGVDITRVGTGTAILSGANTYTGSTDIIGGTLALGGDAGGTFGGTGVFQPDASASIGYNSGLTLNSYVATNTIAGGPLALTNVDLNFNFGGTVTGGAGTDTINFLNLGSGTQISGATPYQLINFAGNQVVSSLTGLVLSAGSNPPELLTLTEVGSTAPSYLSLITNTGTGGSGTLLTADTPVPEPSTWALLTGGLIGLALLGGSRRFRSTKA